MALVSLTRYGSDNVLSPDIMLIYFQLRNDLGMINNETRNEIEWNKIPTFPP